MKFFNKFFSFIIAFLLIGYSLFYYSYKNKLFIFGEDKVKSADFSSMDMDKVVNKYLKQTTKQMLIDRVDTKMKIDKNLQQLNQANKTQDQNQFIPAERQIHREVEENTTPAQEISKRINEEITIKELEKIDKKEYARQFIENARKGGYHIELSEDLNVIKVTPIRKPSQEFDSVEIFPSN